MHMQAPASMPGASQHTAHLRGFSARPFICPAGLCKLDLMLVSQTVESVWLSALYPVSIMAHEGLAQHMLGAVSRCTFF